MKKILGLMLAAAVLLWSGAANAQSDLPENEAAVSFNYWFPGDGDWDLYDTALGLELQYRNWTWLNDPFGVALSLGAATWKVKSDASDFAVPALHDLDGNVTLIPVGASALLRFIDFDSWRLFFEVGLRYVFVSSDVDAQYDMYNPDDDSRWTEETSISIDNGLIAVGAMDFDFDVADQVSVFATLGYQFDLMKGKTTLEINDNDLRDNELQGVFLRLGGKYMF